VQKRNNIIIGDLIIDQNYITEPSGKSAEFNARKFKLIEKNLNLGGAGMVFSALKKLDNNANFLTIAQSKYKKIFNKLQLTDIIFSDKITIEKKRYWENNKLLFQLNNIKFDQKEIRKFQTKLLKKINKIKNQSNILLCDYRYGIFSNEFTKKIIRIFKKKNCELYVDQQSTSLNPDIGKFKNVNYLILNLDEYNKIFKIYKIKEKTLLKKLTKLQKILSINTFVVKRGSKGCSIFKNKGIISATVDKKRKQSINTIGAGDYFLSAFVINRTRSNLQRIKFSNNYAYSKIIGKSKVKTF